MAQVSKLFDQRAARLSLPRANTIKRKYHFSEKRAAEYFLAIHAQGCAVFRYAARLEP
jgi:hypothetical protein